MPEPIPPTFTPLDLLGDLYNVYQLGQRLFGGPSKRYRRRQRFRQIASQYGIDSPQWNAAAAQLPDVAQFIRTELTTGFPPQASRADRIAQLQLREPVNPDAVPASSGSPLPVPAPVISAGFPATQSVVVTGKRWWVRGAQAARIIVRDILDGRPLPKIKPRRLPRRAPRPRPNPAAPRPGRPMRRARPAEPLPRVRPGQPVIPVPGPMFPGMPGNPPSWRGPVRRAVPRPVPTPRPAPAPAPRSPSEPPPGGPSNVPKPPPAPAAPQTAPQPVSPPQPVPQRPRPAAPPAPAVRPAPTASPSPWPGSVSPYIAPIPLLRPSSVPRSGLVPRVSALPLPGSPLTAIEPGSVSLPVPRPATQTNPDRCQCQKQQRKRKKRKPREVCYRGTYTETASGLIKHRKEKVPCQASRKRPASPLAQSTTTSSRGAPSSTAVATRLSRSAASRLLRAATSRSSRGRTSSSRNLLPQF